jgi:hypothetical protein
MDKKGLSNVLDSILIPHGFKRKGNYWLKNGEVLSKMVNLQKSNAGNNFYINYGYIVKALPLGNQMMHIYNRVSSLDIEEKKHISGLLNLENDMSDNLRRVALINLLEEKLLNKLQVVNTEEDLLGELKKRQTLNDITQSVKQHFNLN